jgi:hypothetical protein
MLKEPYPKSEAFHLSQEYQADSTKTTKKAITELKGRSRRSWSGMSWLS